MEYQDFIATLPINNFHRFDDPKDWLDAYSHLYPTEEEREEIYRLAQISYDLKFKGAPII